MTSDYSNMEMMIVIERKTKIENCSPSSSTMFSLAQVENEAEDVGLVSLSLG